MAQFTIRLRDDERDLAHRALLCMSDILDESASAPTAEHGLRLAALYTRDQLRALASKFEPRAAR